MPNASLCCLQGAIMVGILFVTIISWIPGHAASYLGSTGDYAGRQLWQGDAVHLLLAATLSSADDMHTTSWQDRGTTCWAVHPSTEKP